MNRERFDYIELAYEYPLCNPLPEKEDYFLLPVLIAEKMGLKAAMFTLATQLTHQKREKINGVDVFTFDSVSSMLKQLFKSAPTLAHGHSFGWLPATLAPLIAKRYVITPHVYRLDIYPNWKVMPVLNLIKKSDALITLTRFECSQFNSVMDKSKIHVIPHPIDYDFFSQHKNDEKEEIYEKYALKKTDRLILSVANLVPRKNFETLILGFAKVKKSVPNSKLIIVGGEPKTILSVSTPKKVLKSYRLKLTELASSVGVKNDVIFAGHQKEHELRKFFAAADVFCLPSKTEGQLLAAGEAAAAGIPLVLSNLEPLLEIYQGCALFHAPMDYEPLAAHIITLLENPELAKTLGNTGRVKMQNYHPEIVHAKLRKLYERLLT